MVRTTSIKGEALADEAHPPLDLPCVRTHLSGEGAARRTIDWPLQLYMSLSYEHDIWKAQQDRLSSQRVMHAASNQDAQLWLIAADRIQPAPLGL